jgi:ADP-heptose:LPS heptosyltransferase
MPPLQSNWLDADRLRLRRRIFNRRLIEVLFFALTRTRSAPAPLREQLIRRILVVRPNHRLGNTVLLTPLLLELRRLFPHAEVDVLAGGRAGAALLTSFGHVRKIWSIPSRVLRQPFEPLRVLIGMRRRHYDLAIDACAESQTGRLFTLLSGARFKIGFDHAQKLKGLTHELPPADPQLHVAKVPVHLLRTIYGVSEMPWPALALPLAAEDRHLARRQLRTTLRGLGADPSRPIIGLYGFATGAKRLPCAWWEPLLGRLGSDSSVSLVEILPGHGESCFAQRFPALYAADPLQLAALLSLLAVFVSADGGVMHLAAAVGTPTVGLFSVTSAARYGPYGNGSIALDVREMHPEAAADAVLSHLNNLRTAGGYLPRRIPQLASGRAGRLRTAGSLKDMGLRPAHN